MLAIVYFIHDPETGLTKIGRTWKARLTERMREHERATGHTLTLLGATPGYAIEERAFHRQLAASRHHTEWFHSSDALAEIVLALPIPSTEFALPTSKHGLTR